MPCVHECRAKSRSKQDRDGQRRGRTKKAPVTQAAIIRAAREAARKNPGQHLSVYRFQHLTGLSQKHVYRLFPRGWTEVQERAGLPSRQPIWSEQRLLEELHRLACKVQCVPSPTQVNMRGRCAAQTYRSRFGSWAKAYERYRAWLEIHHPDVPWLHELPRPKPDTLPLPPMAQRKRRSREYGNPLNFRSLGHAPTNEQGVVFLFGVVSAELGFLVEALHAQSYPDGEALRCIDKRNGRWEHVRIEFEFAAGISRSMDMTPVSAT